MSFIEEKPIRDGLDPSDLLRMNVGRRWWHCRLTDIPDGLLYKTVVMRFIEKLADHVRNGRGLLLHGQFSTGKTGSAVIVAKATVCHGGTALFVPISELADQKFEKAMFEEKTSMWKRMCDVDLLVLDDLGAEHGKDWGASLVERIVRIRSNNKRSIIATTNRLSDLQSVYGDSTLVILRSIALPVLVEGKDWRTEESEDLAREILGQ
jgi:DNA replication protein DnaC